MSVNTSLANHLLVAMPSLNDPDFKQSVIYVCEHHTQGSVGLIINRPMDYPLGFVFDQLQIESGNSGQKDIPLLFGGPAQPDRGFVIHRPSGTWHTSLDLHDEVTVTTSNDIIRAIAVDSGPQDLLVTLGYTIWDENQLEQEMLDNVWLVCPFTADILYDVPFKDRWLYAGATIGVDMNQLVSSSGHA